MKIGERQTLVSLKNRNVSLKFCGILWHL